MKTPMTSSEINLLCYEYGFGRGLAPIMNLVRAVERRCGVEGGRLYSHADGSSLAGPWFIRSKPEAEAEDQLSKACELLKKALDEGVCADDIETFLREVQP